MIGREIRRIRHERDLKLRELARLANISPSSLTRIEAEQVSPNISTIERLAGALGVDASELLSASSGDATQAGVETSDREGRRLLSAFHALDRDQQRLVLKLAEELARLIREASPDDFEAAHLAAEPPTSRAQTARQYVQGWDRETALDHLAFGHKYLLSHTAGAQFSKPFEPVGRGDVMWIVFVDAGKLHLVGRLAVAARRDFASDLRSVRHGDDVIFTQRDAERILRSRDVWVAPEHLLARHGEAEKLKDLPVPTDIVRRLTFKTSAGTSEVSMAPGGAVAGQAFRSVRLLTPASAGLLEQLWANS